MDNINGTAVLDATTEAAAFGLVAIHPSEVVAEAEAVVDRDQVEAELRAEIEELRRSRDQVHTDLSAEIARLTGSVERHAETIEGMRNRLTDAIQKHKRDIATIGERLIEEADDRSWCDIFDDVVTELNEKLSEKLPQRERDYVVTVEVTVTCRSEDDAREEVNGMLRWQNFDITEINRD